MNGAALRQAVESVQALVHGGATLGLAVGVMAAVSGAPERGLRGGTAQQQEAPRNQFTNVEDN